AAPRAPGGATPPNRGPPPGRPAAGAAALAEAVRNSLRHAGVPARRVRREVTVTVGAGGLLVVLRDDGKGFDRAAVPPDRLGIAASILGRMRQLPGGAGFVESAPGHGTTVTLMWGSAGGADGTDAVAEGESTRGTVPDAVAVTQRRRWLW
ncbi:ATP-binding protein, partial [Nocardia carnea]|uniref:ATP-binding protein n=1 Tax=Nocardia carnea TaxID=37328 RepID=UPI0032AF47DD